MTVDYNERVYIIDNSTLGCVLLLLNQINGVVEI
jgi:hypothetical protein